MIGDGNLREPDNHQTETKCKKREQTYPKGVIKMVETSFPKCPICKKEVLVPLSASLVDMGSVKTFAHWICLRCGFYFGTRATNAYNIPKDLFCGMLPEVVEQMRKCSEEYEKAVKEGRFHS